MLWPALHEYEGLHKSVLDALENRTSWGMIKHWKGGRLRAPLWVRRILATKAKEKAAALLHVAALLENDSR